MRREKVITSVSPQLVSGGHVGGLAHSGVQSEHASSPVGDVESCHVDSLYRKRVSAQTTAGQSQYQVRFDWGIQGAQAIAADVDVIVLVDVLMFGTNADLAVAAGGSLSPLNHADAGARLAMQLVDQPAIVVAGCLRNTDAIARWALEQQGEKRDRFSVAVIAAGDVRADGSTRFALEDLLGAGAVIEALADVGIDYYSPEAAAAAASFTGLRTAIAHLISASESGRRLAARGQRGDLDVALDIGASQRVPVLRDAGFASPRFG
jgi:phosphosulfolactate phosphohydrolase-like enzyme